MRLQTSLAVRCRTLRSFPRASARSLNHSGDNVPDAGQHILDAGSS